MNELSQEKTLFSDYIGYLVYDMPNRPILEAFVAFSLRRDCSAYFDLRCPVVSDVYNSPIQFYNVLINLLIIDNYIQYHINEECLKSIEVSFNFINKLRKYNHPDFVAPFSLNYLHFLKYLSQNLLQISLEPEDFYDALLPTIRLIDRDLFSALNLIADYNTSRFVRYCCKFLENFLHSDISKEVSKSKGINIFSKKQIDMGNFISNLVNLPLKDTQPLDSVYSNLILSFEKLTSSSCLLLILLLPSLIYLYHKYDNLPITQLHPKIEVLLQTYVYSLVNSIPSQILYVNGLCSDKYRQNILCEDLYSSTNLYYDSFSYKSLILKAPLFNLYQPDLGIYREYIENLNLLSHAL